MNLSNLNSYFGGRHMIYLIKHLEIQLSHGMQFINTTQTVLAIIKLHVYFKA